jgi:hypothetical protein
VTRASFVAAAALAAAAAGCGKSSTPSVTGQLRQPSSIATFVGFTVANGSQLLPYVAIANTDRNDLTILNPIDDSVVKAPVQLRPLAIPVERPALLASTSLGEETTPEGRKADLLVVVSSGSSRLQLVQTWNPANTIADQANGVTYAVDLPGDVLAAVPIPSVAPRTARLAVAITGQRLAIVHYRRSDDGVGIEPDTTGGPAVVVQPLAFEAASLATMPGDPDHVYVATRDPIPTLATPVLGVAQLDVSARAGPWPARALGARAGTRLVTAAALHAERRDDAIATDTTAFGGQPPAKRIYAVLDEGSCGHDRAIDCGIVAIDPALDTATRGNSIPDDWTSALGERWMPYRAPIQLPARALAIAASQPPALPPSADDADQVYHGDFMRLAGTGNWATTAVGAVATADGQLRFLDLGRFKEATIIAVPPTTVAGVGVTVPQTDNRLWLQDDSGQFVATSRDARVAAIGVTPGWTPNEFWTVGYQAALPRLSQRRADVGSCAAAPGCAGGDPAAPIWLAVQFAGPGPAGPDRKVTQVARLFHPALGVHEGDIVVFPADVAGPACVGTSPPGTSATNDATTPHQFEAQIKNLLGPDAGRPGGFVTLTKRVRLENEPPRKTPVPGEPKDQWEKWDDCFDALKTKIDDSGGIVPGIVVSIHAQELVLTGSTLGYAGRPRFGQTFLLQHRATDASHRLVGGDDEDALVAACPLVDWDGTLPPPTCGGGACLRDLCESAVLARKTRRLVHVSEDCGTNQTCIDRSAALGLAYPVANGPLLRLRVDQQDVRNTSNTLRDRTLSLSFNTTNGVAYTAIGAAAVALPNAAITFDRSPFDQAGSYRFLVTYPAGLVVDASPVVSPVSGAFIR